MSVPSPVISILTVFNPFILKGINSLYFLLIKILLEKNIRERKKRKNKDIEQDHED